MDLGTLDLAGLRGHLTTLAGALSRAQSEADEAQRRADEAFRAEDGRAVLEALAAKKVATDRAAEIEAEQRRCEEEIRGRIRPRLEAWKVDAEAELGELRRQQAEGEQRALALAKELQQLLDGMAQAVAARPKRLEALRQRVAAVLQEAPVPVEVPTIDWALPAPDLGEVFNVLAGIIGRHALPLPPEYLARVGAAARR